VKLKLEQMIKSGLKGKTAIVTGGAKGIGLAAVRVFLEEGANVVIADMDEEAGLRAAANSGDNVLFVKTDVSKYSEVQEMVQKAVSQFGTLHFLVNNAAIIRYSTAVTCSEEEWDLMMDVNLKTAAP
jgi:3-oxoacyl-[acyl-carrier protein] reductase